MTRERDALKLADSITVTCVRLVRALRGTSRSADLTEPEISALSVIVYSKRMLARDLAGMEGVTSATISRVLAAMEAKGLVEKTPDRHDSRRRWITATPHGKRRISEGHVRRVGPLASIIAGLPHKERETLAAAASILNAAIARLKHAGG